MSGRFVVIPGYFPFLLHIACVLSKDEHFKQRYYSIIPRDTLTIVPLISDDINFIFISFGWSHQLNVWTLFVVNIPL